MNIVIDVADLGSIDLIPNVPFIEALVSLNGFGHFIAWSRESYEHARSWSERCLNGYGVHCTMVVFHPEPPLPPLPTDSFYVSSHIHAGSGMSPDAFIEYARNRRAEWDASHEHADHGGGH